MLKEILLIVFSVVGFSLSFYIWNKSLRKKEKLVCMIDEGGCDDVIKSSYGKTFGIDNTILGMIYYFFVFATSILILIYPSLSELIFSIPIMISGFAALFSVYLIFIQLVVLKKWCEYCLASSGLSLVIFLIMIL